MSRVINGRFACDACGKTFKWKAELAGKRAKCTCGAMITVPAGMEEPPAEDLYDFVEPAAETKPAKSVRPPIARAVAAAAAPDLSTSKTLAYQSARTEKEKKRDDVFIDRNRDFVGPIVALSLGFVLILAWAMMEGGGFFLIGIVSVLTIIATAVKTGILIALALAFATQMGLSFGTLKTAVLKFAAIVVLTDAVDLWFDTLMKSSGATRRGYISLRQIILGLFIAAVFISFLSHYFFNMDRDETAMFALPMALISQVIGFVMGLVVVAIITGIVRAMMPAPAAPTNPTVTNAPAAPPSFYHETATDREVKQRMSDEIFLKEAREWDKGALKRTYRDIILSLYDAGAMKVSVDLKGSNKMLPTRIYVELPESAAKRSRILSECRTYSAENGLNIDPSLESDHNQRYGVIQLNTEQAK